MNINKENYRVFEKSNFVFQQNAGKQSQETAPSNETNEKKDTPVFTKDDFNRMKKMDPEARQDFVRQKVESVKSETFEEMIRKQYEGKKDSEKPTEAQVKNAKEAYEFKYNNALARLFRRIEQRQIDYEQFNEDILKAKKIEMAKLIADTENSARAADATPEFKNSPQPAHKTPPRIDTSPDGLHKHFEKIIEEDKRWPYKIPIVGPIFENYDIPILSKLFDSSDYRKYKEFQYQCTEKFKTFIGAMNAKYLESKQNEAKMSKAEKEAYEDLSGKFKKNIESETLKQLDFMYENSFDKDMLVKNLENVRDKMKGFYTDNDKNGDEVLDYRELRGLEKSSQQYVELGQLINSSENDEDLMKKLETNKFFQNGNWKAATNYLTEQMIMDASKNGTEGSFINGVKKLLKTQKNMSFDEAADKFRRFMKKRADVGVKETIKSFQEFNNDANAGRPEIMDMKDLDLSPALREMVNHQRALILSGGMVSNIIDDRLVVGFMNATLVMRSGILTDGPNRQELFQAIQNIKKQNLAEYDKKYRGNKVAPSEDSARLIAMLTLAREAEWIINSMDKSKDYKDLKLADKLVKTEAELRPPQIDRKFINTNKLHRMGYISAAEQGGFNGKDIAIRGVQIWAGLTLFINFMNAGKHSDKHGIAGWLEGATSLATNPYALAAGGLIYGINQYHKNPEVKNYLFADAGGQERISTHIGLTNLQEKVGKARLFGFISSFGEFEAMKEMFTDPNDGVNKVKQLLKQKRDKVAKEKSKNPPVLTKQDLKDSLSIENWSRIPEGNDRTRFLFYEKFLTSPKNIRQLKFNCENWT